MKVVFTEEALQGLQRIGDFIAQDSPRRAISFLDELEAAATGLGDTPDAFPLVPQFERLEIRRRVHGDYLILYRIEVDRVSILLVVHGAQDYGRLLAPEG